MRNQFFIYRTIITCLLIAFCFNITTAALAEQAKATAPVTNVKTISGEVGVIRSDYITVIYNKKIGADGSISDKEILFPIDNNLKFVYKRSLSQIQEGDTIEITYDEKSWVDKRGVGRRERKATQLKFIRSKPRGLRSGN